MCNVGFILAQIRSKGGNEMFIEAAVHVSLAFQFLEVD